MQHNQALIEQRRHYAAVKARLYAKPVAVPVVEEPVVEELPVQEVAEFEVVSPVSNEVVMKTNSLSVFAAAELVRQIIREECARHGVSPKDVASASRFKEVVYCRHWIMYRIHEATSWSLPRIGRYFNKDHTTVLHGLRKIKAEIMAEKAKRGPVEL